MWYLYPMCKWLQQYCAAVFSDSNILSVYIQGSTITFLGTCASGNCITKSSGLNQFLICPKSNMIMPYEYMYMSNFVWLNQEWPELEGAGNVDDITTDSAGTCVEHSGLLHLCKQAWWSEV